MLLSPGRASCKTPASSKRLGKPQPPRPPVPRLAATPNRVPRAALEEFCQTRQESSPSNLRQSTRTFTHISRTFHAKNMTNKSPRLPRKAFTLPGPPAPPNSPALLGGKLHRQSKTASRCGRRGHRRRRPRRNQMRRAGDEDRRRRHGGTRYFGIDVHRVQSTRRVGKSAEARLLDPRRLQARDAGARRDAGRRLETGSDHLRQRRGAGFAVGERGQGPRIGSASKSIAARKAAHSKPTILSFLKKKRAAWKRAASARPSARASPVAARAGQTAPHGPRRPRPPGVHEPLGRPRARPRRAS